MQATTQAAGIFELFRERSDAERFEVIRSMIAERHIESESLDFKAAGHVDLRGDDGWLMREWSKYVSAFGNTGGGVLIWGVQTSKINGRDAAEKCNHVRDPAIRREVGRSAN